MQSVQLKKTFGKNIQNLRGYSKLSKMWGNKLE